jgi:hypothetical protein
MPSVSPLAENFDTVATLAARLQPAFDPQLTHIDGLRNLLELLYHASLVPEEGRYPRFRVICGRQLFGHGVSFEEPWPKLDTVEAVRRLAPALSDPNTALMVVGNDRTGFSAYHIIDFREHSVRGDAESVYRLSDDALPEGTLTIRVDGPGELRASVQPGPVFHLRGGRIRELTPFDQKVPPFNDLVTEHCSHMQTALFPEPKSETPPVQAFVDEFLFVWATAMSDAINARHGGAFIILPKESSQYVESRYEASCDLFTAFSSTVESVLKMNIQDVAPIWLLYREHVLRVAHMVGRLSATDGAVVLNRSMRVLGFGAKIVGTNPHLPLLDVTSGVAIGESELGGMRHQSAARLVRSEPGTIAFVVSQDGDLTAFYSDAEQAHRHANLDAWASVSDFL